MTDRVLPGESLSGTLLQPDNGISQSSYRIIDCGNPGIVREVWSRKFCEGPAVLLTEGIQNLRLDGLLTLIAITHGNLGGLMNLTR